MKKTKPVGWVFCRMFRQVWLLPKTIAKAGERRRRQNVLREREAERLDRICNPSKYLGK